MQAEIKLKRFRAYQRGYTDAAGARPIDDVQRAKHVHEYDLGWDRGQSDRKKAMLERTDALGITIPTIHALEDMANYDAPNADLFSQNTGYEPRACGEKQKP